MQALDRILEILDEHTVFARCRECNQDFTNTELTGWKEVEKVFRKGNVIYEGVCPEWLRRGSHRIYYELYRPKTTHSY